MLAHRPGPPCGFTSCRYLTARSAAVEGLLGSPVGPLAASPPASPRPHHVHRVRGQRGGGVARPAGGGWRRGVLRAWVQLVASKAICSAAAGSSGVLRLIEKSSDGGRLHVIKHGGFERGRTNPALLDKVVPLETLCAASVRTEEIVG